MRKVWHDDAWDDYLYWQTQDKKTLKKSFYYPVVEESAETMYYKASITL